MLKKISVALIAALLMALAAPAVMAALPVDYDNVQVDNFQEGGHEPFRMFMTDPIGDGVRFAGHVNPDTPFNLEEGEPVLINGSGTLSITVPFTQTVNVESFNVRWINPSRQYFFLVYSSMDGSDWSRVNVVSNGSMGTVDPTVGPAGFDDGPAAEVFVSVPAGDCPDYNVNTLNFAFDAPATANYIRITLYGNDNATGDLEVRNYWISFNNLSFEGSIYVPAAVEPEPADDEPAPVAADAPAVAAAEAAKPAPPTADPVTLLVLGSLASAAGLVALKKRK